MDYKVRAAGRSHKIEIKETVQVGGAIMVATDRQEVPVVLHSVSKDEEISLIAVNNKWFSANVVRGVDGFPKEIVLNGVPYPVEIERVESTRYRPQTQARKVDGKVFALLPGLISDVVVEAGTHVTKGETLLVLEAMKMENEITSPIDGWITSVEVRAGQVVSKGELLVIVADAT